jgi:hypothetical protein
MNESPGNILKTVYDINLYKELREMRDMRDLIINRRYTSDIMADMDKTLSERMTAMLTSVMKDLPIYDGCKSLVIANGNPDLYIEKSEQDDILCFVIMWHCSGLMFIMHFGYQRLREQFDKKKKTEKDFIRETMLRPYANSCLLANEFDYEFEKTRSNEEITQMRQEAAQSKINEKLCGRLWRNSEEIFTAYRKHFGNGIPLVTRYTISRVRMLYNQHTNSKRDDSEFIAHCTYIECNHEQKINSLLRQINNAEKLIATLPTIYTRFDEFKQHITAHIIRIMLDEKDSSWSLKSPDSYCEWEALMPIINLYPGLISMHERYIITPGKQLYDLKTSILTKYTNLTNQTLTTDEARESAAMIFVPTEQHTNSVLQDMSTIDVKGNIYSIAGIKQVLIPITKTDITDSTADCSGKFCVRPNSYNIEWKMVNDIKPIYKENPDDRERIENCISTTIDNILRENFADPNSAEFKRYVDSCKTCITNIKANVMAIKDTLLSSDDTDFIKYLYESKHIYKKEYDARIKQIEEQDNAEVTV